jgi:hypothetical protein
MKPERFRAVLLEGHKEPAFEVPFDPAERWGTAPVPLRPGRRGHRVRATIRDVPFESAIVGRSKRFWLLVPAEVQQTAGIVAGDEADVSLLPM